jgi:hypothetical protein
VGVPEQIAGRAESCLLVRAQTTPPTGLSVSKGTATFPAGQSRFWRLGNLPERPLVLLLTMVLIRLAVENGREGWVWEIQTEGL